MTVESALYPSQFNTAWPQASDMVSEGDNHIRLTKTVIKTTFPNVAGAVSATDVQLSYVTGVTSAIQAQIDNKGAIAGQTWTGTHAFPSTTTIGGLTPTIRGYLETVTSDAQAQIDARALKAGNTYSGTHNFTGATINVPTLSPGATGNGAASVDFANALAFSAALPVQAGNAGKFVTTDGTNASWSDTLAGSLNFSGTGRRITADFSNATVANQLAFQTSTANNNTRVGILPNGTGNVARVAVCNNSDPTNSSEVSLAATSTDTRIESSLRGSGSYLPFTTYVGGFKNTEQPIAGGLLVTSAAGLGYGTGAGGTVTQATSKSTAVTLDKPCGLITMNNAALAAGGTALFTFSNSLIGAGDVLFLQLDSTGIASTADYNVWSSGGAGAAVVALKNISAGSLSEAVRLRFVVIKGSQS